jgi:hypothetical protein
MRRGEIPSFPKNLRFFEKRFEAPQFHWKTGRWRNQRGSNAAHAALSVNPPTREAPPFCRQKSALRAQVALMDSAASTPAFAGAR